MRKVPRGKYLPRMTQQLSAGVVPEWTLGDRLRKARELTGLEAAQLAVEIGVHRDTIANYEKGRVRPRPG